MELFECGPNLFVFRPVVSSLEPLGISEQSIYAWRRQARIDAGLEAGLTSAEKAELVAAKQRTRELETELAIRRRATELLKGDSLDPKGPTRRSR